MTTRGRTLFLRLIADGAISFREHSNRVLVLPCDQPSADPSDFGGSSSYTLAEAIDKLKSEGIRVVATPYSEMDSKGQVTAVTKATGGVIVKPAIDFLKPLTEAIVGEMHTLNLTIDPQVPSSGSCKGYTLIWNRRVPS
jgi:hypothetical protein